MNESDSFVVNIHGIDEIAKILKELPAKMERSVIIAALKEAGKPIRDEARALAPTESGDLMKSIKTVSVAKKYSAGGGPRVRVTSGSKQAFYGHIIEGGAKPHSIEPKNKKAVSYGDSAYAKVKHPGIKARHFMLRAFRSKGHEAIIRFGESLRPKLEKALGSFFKRRS